MGYEGRTASSTVPDEAVPRLRASGGRVKPGSKPRAATEEQLPRRRVGVEQVSAPAEGNGQVDGARPGTAGAAAGVVEIPETPEPPVGADASAPTGAQTAQPT